MKVDEMKKRLRSALADAERHAAGEELDAAVLAAAPLLEGWVTESVGPGHFVLVGYVTGHPHLDDGLITTSLIVALADDDSWARTIGRYYRLGRPLFSRGHA